MTTIRGAAGNSGLEVLRDQNTLSCSDRATACDASSRMGNRESMRVMHVFSSFTTGGAETNATRLIASLAERGFEQIVVSLTPSVDHALASSLAVGLHYPRQRRGLVRSVAFLSGMVSEFAPHLIHGRAFRTWAECALAKTLATSPPKLIQSFHGTTSFDVQLARRKVIAFCLGDATDRFVTVSHDLAARLHGQWHIPRKRIEVVTNGVDVQLFRQPKNRATAKWALGLDECTFVVGTVGSMRAVKNHGLLFEAFARLSGTIRDCTLLLVGDGPLRNDLTRRAQQLGVSERVKFCGRQSNVRTYLAAMDLFVQSSWKEGSPTAVLEAMACGVPVIAARSSGCVELHERVGVPQLVDGNDAEALAGMMIELAQNPHRASELAGLGRQAVVDGFSFERMLNSYEQVYRSQIQIDQPAVVAVTS